ncbi:Mdm33 family-domain-containing protein [Nemania sp. NC0429]|nr:Mdm33 family-domain-containing protein [Nemania sp. NC0429]
MSMSTSRAMRPLFGASSRLVVDRWLVPKSAVTAAIATMAAERLPERIPKRLFCCGRVDSRGTSTTRPATSTFWSCRRQSHHDYEYNHNYDYVHHSHASRRQRLRFSSSASKPPPPGEDGTARHEPQTYSSSTSSSSPSPSSPRSRTTNTADATQTTAQEPPINQSNPEQARDQDGTSSSPSLADLDLPSAQNSRRSHLNQSLSSFMDRAQTTLFAASQRINDLTGYSSIESLKSQISDLESELRAAQSHLNASRAAYKAAVSDRSATQREVTTLLARQKTWTPLDFERFTTLYRRDYELEASVGSCAAELERAERDAERLNRELGAAILARYHEEQIWSDKIRRMSTWGTWGLMGMNILLFLVLQFGAEPWRRRRLVRGFEEKVREALAEERVVREGAERGLAAATTAAATTAAATTAAAAIADTPTVADSEVKTESEVKTATDEGGDEPVIMTAPDVVLPEPDILPPPPQPNLLEFAADSDSSKTPPSLLSLSSWREALLHLEHWRSVLTDLFSDRGITLRMRDVSLIAIEGAVTGAAVVWTIVFFMIPKTP